MLIESLARANRSDAVRVTFELEPPPFHRIDSHSGVRDCEYEVHVHGKGRRDFSSNELADALEYVLRCGLEDATITCVAYLSNREEWESSWNFESQEWEHWRTH